MKEIERAFVYFFVLKKIYERRFRRRFPAFLDLLIMRVHMGTSIKESLKITLAYEPSYFQNIMVRVLDLAQYDELRGEKRGYFLLKLVQVFYKIEQQPHQALRIFENLRYQLKLENYFRHKSGQLTKQVWLQVYILAAMYLALLVFVLKFYNKQNYQPFLFPSFSLFIVGVMALFYLGRKRKWKV